ncbi:MAG TPA: hypothetical protein VF735_15095 [Pyrinomonadaceae bacterium]|jgi:hypothetical protein
MSNFILFDEVLLDPDIFFVPKGQMSPVVGGPEYANAVLKNDQTGICKTAVLRYDQIENLTVNLQLLNPDQIRYLVNFINGGWGSGVGFRVIVPHDYYVEDEVFGTAQSGVLAYPLQISYRRPGVTNRENVRRIVKPVTNIRLKDLGAEGGSVTLLEPDGDDDRVIEQELVIKVGNSVVTNYTVNNTTGWVYFSSQPSLGQLLRVTTHFDVPMAFTDNQFSLRVDVSGEAQSLGLREILPAELGIE